MAKKRMGSPRLEKCSMGFDDTATKTPVNPMSFCSALYKVSLYTFGSSPENWIFVSQADQVS